MDRLILAIDLGTTSVKAAVFDLSGAMRAQATEEYDLLTPQPNFVEAETDIHYNSIRAAVHSLGQTADLQAVCAVGFSAQGETLFFVDSEGRPVRRPIIWMDNRAGAEAERLREQFGDELCYEVTGQVSFESCWPASKVLWVKNNEPEVFSKTSKVLLIEDYIISLMTGEYVTEGSLLTSTEYWDIRTKDYWPEMLQAIGLKREMLPKILESGVPVAKILPEAAQDLGISPEAVVCTGCLDQAAGAIGVGNIHSGIFSENIGAALAVCVPTSELVYDPARVMPVHYFALPDTYMIHTFTTGGMAMRWFRDTFCQQELSVSGLSGIDPYYQMDMQAAQVPPGSEGLVMLPHLNGSMAPDMNADAKGVYFGFSMKHRKPHFIRALMESVGYIIRRNLDALENMGLHVDEIRSLGGGSKSDVWNQIKADILGIPVVVMDSKEAACLGAAILAGKAVGAFPDIKDACRSMVHEKKRFMPNSENSQVYKKQYEQYQRLFSDLSNCFKYTDQ